MAFLFKAILSQFLMQFFLPKIITKFVKKAETKRYEEEVETAPWGVRWVGWKR